MKNDWEKAEEILREEGIGVLPTDTIYGLVGSAFSKKAVEKIYRIKKRNTNKPLILLIISYNDLKLFNIELEKDQVKFLQRNWPGKISVVLSCRKNKWFYLHRGTNSLAFRMVDQKNKNLFDLIKRVGPLVAPSANPESEKPAENISQAKKYFGPARILRQDGNQIDFYINVGSKKVMSSTLIKFEGKNIIILRQGKVGIK